MKGKSVRPQKWANVLDLYDDGVCSAIWGNYDGNTMGSLGIRWNGKGNDVGYPNQGSHPTWFVMPRPMTMPLLSDFYQKLCRCPGFGSLANVEEALRKFLLQE